MRRPLETFARLAGRGEIRARLYDAGGFPAAVPDAEGRVSGELFEMQRPRPLLGLLDRYEGRRPGGGGLFRREVLAVQLVDGGSRRAWAYLFDGDPGGLTEIASGDYLEYLEGRGHGSPGGDRPPI